jgi:hypothetical protein
MNTYRIELIDIVDGNECRKWAWTTSIQAPEGASAKAIARRAMSMFGHFGTYCSLSVLPDRINADLECTNERCVIYLA